MGGNVMKVGGKIAIVAVALGALYLLAKRDVKTGAAQVIKIIIYEWQDSASPVSKKQIMHYWLDNGKDYWDARPDIMTGILHAAEYDNAEITYESATNEAKEKYNQLSQMLY